MLLGIWRNIDELEEALNMDELQLLLEAKREEQMRTMKFQAALKGIDLDKAETKNAEEDFMRVKRRVEAKRAGKSDEQFEMDELGFDIEVEDETV